jgi:predicted phosphohydrolase
MKICWITDPHLNFVREWRAWWQSILEEDDDAYLITGDIAEAGSIVEIMKGLGSMTMGKPIMFVLGNHDFYGGSIVDVREEMAAITTTATNVMSGLLYLPAEPTVWFGKTAFVGVDGWYDGRNGDFKRSGVVLNDFFTIEEFRACDLAGRGSKAMMEVWKVMARLTDADAELLRAKIRSAIKDYPEHLIIATHVPPFAGAAWHEGKVSDKTHLPFFSNRAIGDVILEETLTFRQAGRKVTVLCGHSHSEGSIAPAENLSVLTGAAVYGKPARAMTILLGP